MCGAGSLQSSGVCTKDFLVRKYRGMSHIFIYLFLGVAFLLLVLLLWAIFISNNLVAKRNRTKQALSTVDVVLKQRSDLIPNLVASAKAYMGHENETLREIARLRAQMMNEATSSFEQEVALNSDLSGLLRRLQVSVEAYPELKADEQFIHLQEQLSEMELQLQSARRIYNAAATEYNNYIEMFPSSLLARRGKHTPVALFEAPKEDRETPRIDTLF